ncbi:MAG: 16S rRNA (uracil(1498)-N(3))-methyltransferase [Clostridia bacterium]|jgi:16S rRNA (uracil1498-N3)-methyltransferase|nr:16S rRNA (uracil(1498)-N(3))-methyltransferase [Clostridia bacterium]MCI1999167.1 16S rRNA (uracil(1498)-N(3))-methyltransferase [Clostridia bacterium]MCI2014880.1 16S rRNA (uracil(1498)-N(3))-methyltransferase [Clostridia bacterium]
MPKYFAVKENITKDSVLLTGDEARHLAVTMRVKTGDTITVCDGENTDYECIITEVEKDSVCAKIIECKRSDTEPETKITLFQGIPKSDKMEFIIQKCVEIGVCEIIPVATKRIVAKMEDEKKAAKKTERWQKIAESAAKQSGRGIIPKIGKPISFKEALEKISVFESALIPYENEHNFDLRKYVSENKAKKIGIFIGPEGGFDESEIQLAKDKGIKPVTLGKRILRTETAGMVAIAILIYELG